MYIKYSYDGLHESFSNSQRKSMDVFMDQRFFCIISSSDIRITKFTKNREIDCYFDINSLLMMVNLDCSNCSEIYSDMICNKLYPIEVILDVDENFMILRIIVFVNCEDTRLISYYGKHGHLRHCVDMKLLDNQYYNSVNDECDKSIQFRDDDYKYAYIALSDKLTEIVGSETYGALRSYIDEYRMSLNKIGTLF